MLKYKDKNFIVLFSSFAILILFISSCKNINPSWKYKILDPYHKDIEHYEYAYRSYPLDIQLNAKDTAFKTYVKIEITTPFDSIKIYPTSAYIKSTHFSDTTHFPISTKIESFPKDSIYTEGHKKVNKERFSGPYFLHNEDKLSIILTFEGFAKYDKNNRNAPFTSEKSDFILYYDIFNNRNPLTFTFIPISDSTKEQE
jgi:hypothetical protein